MSRDDTAREPSDRRESSESVFAELHLLGCGHGDTLFLRLPGNRWILIDCHLRSRETQDRFFEFVRANRIERLEYIFQTHPDFDHFCGMIKVLEYFTSEGRSIGYWCDGGLDASQVRHLVWDEELSETEYSKLHDRLDELSDAGSVQTVSINDWSRPISPKGFTGRIDLFPVGPPAHLSWTLARRDTKKLSADVNAAIEKNALSLVLVLSLSQGDATCNFLLAADAGVTETRDATKTWESRASERDRKKTFHVIKVPHHGSIRSHADDLSSRRASDKSDRVAAISAGTRPGLPDREVLRAYLDGGWITLSTTTRTPRSSRGHLMDIADRSRNREFQAERHDISVRWSPKDGLTWEPKEARIGFEDLESYDTNVS